MNEKGYKNGVIELWRFVAALLIMACHMHIFGVHNYYFFETWIYVEFFLIITGFFTAKHFDGIAGLKCEADSMSRSLMYTCTKFKLIMIQAGMVTICAYSFDFFRSASTLGEWLSGNLGGAIADILLVSEIFRTPLVVPLWYLSALFIVFPIVCMLCQMKDKGMVIYACAVIFLGYYGYRAGNGDYEAPYGLLRALAGCMIGVFVYRLSCLIDSRIRRVHNYRRKITMLQMVCFCFALYASVTHRTVQGVNILMLAVGSCMTCADWDFSYKVKGNFLNYLGNLSLYIFIWHWFIGMICNEIYKRYSLDTWMEIIIFYLSTIIVAVVIKTIFDSVRNVITKAVRTKAIS